jgi:hypothetical protein
MSAQLCKVPMMTSRRAHVRTAPAAAQAAGISYRQLDHWARRGWVVPSEVDEVSAGRKVRQYTRLDVARLAALRHFARSGHDIAALGSTVGQVDLEIDVLLVARAGDEQLLLIDVDDLAEVVTGEGAWTVFDPTPFLVDADVDKVETTVATLTNRRTA